jgi:succinoglycan biosynthesis transport protein ExoP
LLACGVLGALAGVVIASIRPVLYEGVTTLLVVPPPRTPTAQINPATFRAILENASLATQVIAEAGLSQTPQTFLEAALDVEQPQGTNVVRIKVRLPDPKQAADASRRLARGAIALTRRLNQEEGSSLQDQLKNHLDDAARRMATAEKELLEYQKGAQVELLKQDTDAMLEERGDLLKLTIAIESERARLDAATKEIGRQTPLLSAGRAVGAEEALRYTQEQAAAANKGKRDGDKSGADSRSLDLTNPYVNPVYQTLDFQIATSRTTLKALEEQRRQIVDVRKIGGQELARLSELYRRQIELARLQTSFDLGKKVYSDLAVRYEESRTQSLGYSPQLQLVDEAIVPDRPLPRQRTRFLALGLVLGVLCAGAAVLLWESRN